MTTKKKKITAHKTHPLHKEMAKLKKPSKAKRGPLAGAMDKQIAKAKKADRKKKPKVEIVKSREYLRVELTEKEILEAARESSAALIQRAALEKDLEEIKKRFKADITQQDNIMTAKASLVENGYEYRNVDCEWHKNWTAGTKYLVRLDTHQTEKKNVKIEDSERQSELAVDW